MSDIKTVQKIDVFISSPSDVQAERDAIGEIISELNAMPSIRERYTLIPLAYEKSAPPVVGLSPQTVVNRYMREANNVDLFIGVLWSKMGTPLEEDGVEYQSGTEYEFRKAYGSFVARGKPIMLLYRCMKSVPAKADVQQTASVQAFFKKFEGAKAEFKGLYKTYKTRTQFKNDLRKHILEILPHIPSDANNIQPQFITPTRRRADYYDHIPLPPNYVERANLLTELRKALIGETPEFALISEVKESAQPQNPAALQGMGGIGKTVMARALCSDPQVQTVFSDGILWATCGQTPNLIQQLRGWIKGLGEIPDDKAELSDLQAQAARLLRDRACLLVVDDVWERKHADAFRLGGVRCRLMITTRNERLAREFGAKVASVPLMSINEAVKLLEEWSGDALNKVNRAMKERIVKRVGRLALAIKLAGAQLIDESPEKWLAHFKVETLSNEEPDEGDPHSSLTRCFGLSFASLSDDERYLYSALAIFREDEAILEQAVAKLWEGLKQFDKGTTHKLILKLGSRALLEITQKEPTINFILHDLLRDLIANELGSRRLAAHEMLIDAYAKTKIGEGWHTAPHDGYLYTHLAYHLHVIRRNEELYALLTDSPKWMEAKYVACVGDRAYVDDLELAISDFHDPLMPEQVLILTKLWTARHIVNMRVNLYTDTDLEIMVMLGHTQQALVYANLRAEAVNRVHSLMSIFSEERLSGHINIAQIMDILTQIQHIDDIYDHDHALLTCIIELIQIGKLDIAQTKLDKIYTHHIQAQALGNIATGLIAMGDPVLGNELFDEALDILDKFITDSNLRSWVLCSLSKSFADSKYIEKSLELANEITNKDELNEALSYCAKREAQFGKFERGYEIAQTIDDKLLRALALCEVAYVSKFKVNSNQISKILEEAEHTIPLLETSIQRILLLCALSNTWVYLGGRQIAVKMVQHALRILDSIIDNSIRAVAMRNLISSAVKLGDVRLAENIFKELQTILFQSEQNKQPVSYLNEIPSNISILCAISTTFSLAGNNSHTNVLLDTIITAIKKIENNGIRNSVLQDYGIALIYAKKHDEALKLANTTDTIHLRDKFLKIISERLANSGQIEEARNLVPSIKDKKLQIAAIGDIASALALAGDYKHAIDTINTINDDYVKAQTLSNLAISLTRDSRFEEALKIARIIYMRDEYDYGEYSPSNYLRTLALSHIASALFTKGQFELAETIFSEAENCARTIHVEYDNFTVVHALSTLYVALMKSNHLDRAEILYKELSEISFSWGEMKNRLDFFEVIATELANVTCRIAKCFTMLGIRDLDDYLKIIIGWRDGFESLQPDLTLDILREAIRIISWHEPQWKEIHEILVKATQDM